MAGLCYRDLEEMMAERGISVDHTTLCRWVQHYAPEIVKRFRWYQGYRSSSWRVDETYVKVKGQWKYYYRAVDKQGRTLDFYLSHTRYATAARRFLTKALRLHKHCYPYVINTDKNPAYGEAIRNLNKDGVLDGYTLHRKVKYLNNIVEADHGKLKRLIKPTLGFQSMKTDHATLKGFEVMNMFRKDQFSAWTRLPDVAGEIRLINRIFDVYPMA